MYTKRTEKVKSTKYYLQHLLLGGRCLLGTVLKHEALVCVLFSTRQEARENMRQETKIMKDSRRKRLQGLSDAGAERSIDSSSPLTEDRSMCIDNRPTLN